MTDFMTPLFGYGKKYLGIQTEGIYKINRVLYFNLKFTGIDIQTPTARSRCLAGRKRVFRIASMAASSRPVFGTPFKIRVSFTRPLSSMNAWTTTTPSIPASCAIY